MEVSIIVCDDDDAPARYDSSPRTSTRVLCRMPFNLSTVPACFGSSARALQNSLPAAWFQRRNVDREWRVDVGLERGRRCVRQHHGILRRGLWFTPGLIQPVLARPDDSAPKRPSFRGRPRWPQCVLCSKLWSAILLFVY